MAKSTLLAWIQYRSIHFLHSRATGEAAGYSWPCCSQQPCYLVPLQGIPVWRGEIEWEAFQVWTSMCFLGLKVVFLSFSLSLLLSFEWLYLKDRTGKECQETGREGRDDMQQKTTGWNWSQAAVVRTHRLCTREVCSANWATGVPRSFYFWCDDLHHESGGWSADREPDCRFI